MSVVCANLGRSRHQLSFTSRAAAARSQIRELSVILTHQLVTHQYQQTSVWSQSQSRHLRMEATMAATNSTAPTTNDNQDPLIQYVVLRSDLWTKLGWPLGSVAAQACHSSTSCLWLFKDDPVTQQYFADIDNLRKVVLEIKDETALKKLSEQLDSAGIQHKLWIEQPENVATSLATKPYPKSVVGPVVRKLQLCKAPIGSK